MQDEERDDSERAPIDEQPLSESSGRSRPRWLSAGLAARILILAAVLHFLVIPQIGGTRRALGLIVDLNLVLVIAAVTLELLALVAYAQLSRVLLPPGQRPSLWRMFRVVLASLSVNHVVPGGAAAGGVLQYRLLTQSGADPARASFAMATQSIGSALVLNVILWLGLLVSLPTTGFQPVYVAAAGVGLVLIAAAGFGVFALTKGRTKIVGIIARLAKRIPRVDEQAIEPVFKGAADQLVMLGQERRLAAIAVGWAAANWLLDASVLWLFIAAFGHRMSIPGLLVAYGLANVLAAIPISPGGLGVIEVTLILSLVGFGAPRAIASLGVASYRIVQFWLPIPMGAIAWVSLSGGRRRDAFSTMRHLS